MPGSQRLGQRADQAGQGRWGAPREPGPREMREGRSGGGGERWTPKRGDKTTVPWMVWGRRFRARKHREARGMWPSHRGQRTVGNIRHPRGAEAARMRVGEATCPACRRPRGARQGAGCAPKVSGSLRRTQNRSTMQAHWDKGPKGRKFQKTPGAGWARNEPSM